MTTNNYVDVCVAAAYGQTGSGKTYTMMGQDFSSVAGTGSKPGSSDNLSSAVDSSSSNMISATSSSGKRDKSAVYSMYDIGEQEGVIPRLCKQLFIVAQQNKAMWNCKKVDLSASYIEIYNERVYDLLSKNVDTPCRIREVWKQITPHSALDVIMLPTASALHRLTAGPMWKTSPSASCKTFLMCQASSTRATKAEPSHPHS